MKYIVFHKQNWEVFTLLESNEALKYFKYEYDISRYKVFELKELK